jgi:PAT family beta-lactamase induction signal transducer AmpG
MSLCSREFKAAHYAVGTAVMSLGATVIGSLGGVIVEQVGYVWLFTISFFAALPSLGLLCWLPIESK